MTFLSCRLPWLVAIALPSCHGSSAAPQVGPSGPMVPQTRTDDPNTPASPSAGDAVFAAIDSLVSPSPELVQRVTSIPLQAGPTPGNELYTTYAGHRPDATPFTDVELRVGPGGALLVLTVSPSVAVTALEVRARYGQEQNLSVPFPTQPASAPVYAIYPRQGAKVKFGYERPGMQRLVSVVIDTIASR